MSKIGDLVNKVYFVTPTTLDIRAVTTMGVSVKVNDSPIGYFGTGLKYAIAVLLRNGCAVRIMTEGEIYNFRCQDEVIRGETFGMIYMNDQRLGFTTQLGRNWQLWQAFRELESNTRDEDGETTLQEPLWRNETIIEVEGTAFVNEYFNRGATFLQTAPLFRVHDLEVHPGPSTRVFYRGVRALDILETPSLYTYNLLNNCELTEDRTIRNVYNLHSQLEMALACSQNEEYIETVVRHHTHDKFEGRVAYSTCIWRPEETFIKIMDRLVPGARIALNPEALHYYFKYKPESKKHTPEGLSKIEQDQLNKALKFLQKLGYEIKYEIIVVKSIGDGGLGLAEDGKIILTKEAFNIGTKCVAGTILEEYIHLAHYKIDETRAMQNFLIDTIMSIGERLNGESL